MSRLLGDARADRRTPRADLYPDDHAARESCGDRARTGARARQLADWLASSEFTDGHPNLFVFNLFNLLAENDATSPDYGMLRAEYRDGADSHPDRLANETIAPMLVDFVIQAIDTYRILREP